MIAQTQAVALRVVPFSRTSHIVDWMSETAGRVTTVVKGAVRAKSAFLGQYDLGYTCELLYYERARNGVHVAKECAPLRIRPRLRQDWRAFACASYLCHLVCRATLPAGERSAEIYDLLNDGLDGLCAAQVNPVVLMYRFELRLLKVLGYDPHVRRCMRCGARLEQARGVFDAAHGGAFCDRCIPVPAPAHAVRLGPDLQSVLRQWSDPRAAALQRNTILSEKQLLALHEIAGTMIAHCLEIGPESRDVAVKTLRYREGLKNA